MGIEIIYGVKSSYKKKRPKVVAVHVHTQCTVSMYISYISTTFASDLARRSPLVILFFLIILLLLFCIVVYISLSPSAVNDVVNEQLIR